MDEVHYLADRFRGAVWEEVIIHLPESVALVSLSATVSNAEEFGEWLATVRGETATIVEERRPVPLYQHVLVGPADVRPVRGRRAAEPDAGQPRADADRPRRLALRPDQRPPQQAQRARAAGPAPAARAARAAARCPSRFEVVERLDATGLLPAIVFIFSRVGCDAAVTQCLNANLRLTTPEERDEILEFVEEPLPQPPRRGPARPRLPRLPRRAVPRRRGPPRRACCRRSRSASRSCSPAACARSCSPPRRSRSASTCRPGRW